MTDTSNSDHDSGVTLLTLGSAQKFIASLPEDSFHAVDIAMTQLENLKDESDPVLRFTTVCQVDDAIQPHLQKITANYLHDAHANKADELRLWMGARGYWSAAASQYEYCMVAAKNAKDKAAQQIRPHLPRIVARVLCTFGECLKWASFRYKPVAGRLWKIMGRAYLLSEQYAFADKPQQIYPGASGIASPRILFLKAIFFQTASLNNLKDIEMELADRLIGQLLPAFTLTSKQDDKTLHWISLGQEQEPSRINSPPGEGLRHLRYFGPGEAAARLQILEQEVETAKAIPVKISRNEHFDIQNFLNVARHLAGQWSTQSPQRQHERHSVRHQIAVLSGFVNSFVMASPEFGGKPLGLPLEKWTVENISQGGFGAVVKQLRSDWIQVGALIVLQASGSTNWMVGLIRRVQHVSDQEIRVGIETLSRRIAALEARTPAATSANTKILPGIPALWLQDDNPKLPIRFVFPSETFNPTEQLEFDYNGRRVALTPVKLLERGSDYDLATYKAAISAT